MSDSRSSTPTNQSPRPSSSPLSHQHRKTVLVGEQLHQAKISLEKRGSQSPRHSFSPSVNGTKSGRGTSTPPSRNSVGGTSPRTSDYLLGSAVVGSAVVGLDGRPPLSPAGSVKSDRSSGASSFADAVSNVSSLVFTPSSEHKILEDLRIQMSASAVRIRDLEKEVRQIPELSSQMDNLQKERGKLANELLDQKEVVQLMKQRISMLHEQNGQLVKLVQVEKGGSGEILLMRNTLVASHAQLKRLQEQVNTIPSLKAQLRGISEENVRVKERETDITKWFPVKLPDGVELLDYKALWDENSDLKATNQKLRDEVQVVEQHLATVTASCDGLRKRMEQFEASQAQMTSLQDRIKRLEVEKADLNEEIIDLKLKPQHVPSSTAFSMDIDSAQLRKEVASLQKNNTQLQSRMEQMRVEARQQKEQLVLKLFEIETMNVKTQKYELEKLVLGMEQIQLHSDSLRSATQSPDLDNSTDDFDFADMSSRDAPPELKMQLVSLNHLKVHGDQTRTLVQSLLIDREELEKRVTELNGRLEEGGVSELEKQLGNTSSKLDLARERIATLERELQASVAAAASDSLEAENRELRAELAQLKSQENRRADLEQSLKQMEEKLQDHDGQSRSLEKLRADKHKAEKRLKEYKEKFRVVATQLQSSAGLMKNYQEQCSALHTELDQAKKDIEGLREENATAKARLEVAEAEGAAEVTAIPSKDVGASGDRSLAEELASLQMKFDELETSWQKDKAEVERLATALSEGREVEETLDQLRSLHGLTCSERDQLRQQVGELTDRISSMSEVEERLLQAQAEKEKSAKKAQELQQNVSELSEQLSVLTTEKDSVQTKLDSLSSEVHFLTERNTELESAKGRANSTLRSKTTELDTLKERLAKADKHLAASQSLETKKAVRVVALESEVRSVRVRAGSVEGERDSLLKRLAERREQVSKVEVAAADREKEIKKEVDGLRQKIEGLQTELSKGVTALEEEREARRELEDEASRLKNEDIPRLHSDLTAAKEETSRIATELQASVAHLKEVEGAVERRTREVETSQRSSEEESVRKLTESERILKETVRELKALEAKHATLEQEHATLQTRYTKAGDEIHHLEEQQQSNRIEVTRLQLKLEASMSALQSCPECAEHRKQGQVVSELESRLKHREEELRTHLENSHQEKKELLELRQRSQLLTNEVEGYKAMVENLTRNVEEADSIKGEYEILKRKIARLEGALSESSQLKHDNQALISLLHETVQELPSFTGEANKDLQEENLRLEQQVSVLSQWNDKHRAEIEALEHRHEDYEAEKHQLLMDLMAKENCEQENQQLKQELKEVEYEVNTLRRQVRADLQEELQVRLETQTQLLTVFNQHNSSLQSQVVNLQDQVRTLGGALEREKPVSPPPMPDVAIPEVLLPVEVRSRTVTDLGKENEILKERIVKLEQELANLQNVSVTVRRRSSTLSAISSVPIAPINEDLQVK